MAASIDSCAQIVQTVASQCHPATSRLPAANFDALAVSIAAQTNAIAAQANYLTIGSIFLGAVAIVAGVGWGWFVRKWAIQAARDSAREWIEANAAGEISRLLAALTPDAVDGGDTSLSNALTQEEQEEGLGGEAA